MIALLRAGSFLTNLAVFAGVPLLCGLAWPWAGVVAAACFSLSWWACGRAPQSETAPPGACAAAERAAERMGAEPPRFVRTVGGWTAGAVRAGSGYGLVVGDEVAPEHCEAVLAHEIAHFTTGDLLWEPLTDGPARGLLAAAHRAPPLILAALPFLVLGAPLARATELRADRLAADTVPRYAGVLRDVAARMEVRGTILYPSVGVRIRHAARDAE